MEWGHRRKSGDNPGDLPMLLDRVGDQAQRVPQPGRNDARGTGTEGGNLGGEGVTGAEAAGSGPEDPPLLREDGIPAGRALGPRGHGATGSHGSAPRS